MLRKALQLLDQCAPLRMPPALMAYSAALLISNKADRISVSCREGDDVTSDELASLLQQLGIA